MSTRQKGSDFTPYLNLSTLTLSHSNWIFKCLEIYARHLQLRLCRPGNRGAPLPASPSFHGLAGNHWAGSKQHGGPRVLCGNPLFRSTNCGHVRLSM